MESMQMQLSRVRKPRVHIVYEVETEGAMVQKELPFVVGVLGDFSGNASQDKRSFKDRKFIQIDRDNFNEIMKKIAPALSLKVENKLKDDGSLMDIELNFTSMADFEPANLVQQIEPLKNLLDIRNQIRDLLTKADRSEELEEIMEEILQNNEQLKLVAGELGIETSTTPENSSPETNKESKE